RSAEGRRIMNLLSLLLVRRKHASRPLRSTLIHTGGVMLLVTLLAASGAGVTYALWTASATTSSTAKGGQLAVTAAFANSGNSTFQNNALTVNGTVTVRNTS